ncbi:MAG: fasciclin domain-containing protein [Myxococcota bacterium]
MNWKRMGCVVALMGVVACGKQEPLPAATATESAKVEAQAEEAAAVAPAPGPESRPDFGKTVAGIAAASKDHTTLVAAVKAADLLGVLASPGGAYTVFAPTNDAFAKLPAGTVEGLLKPESKSALQGVLKHHTMVPVRQIGEFKDGEVLLMADGSKVTVAVKDGVVTVDGAKIVASVPASNGVVHVVDGVLVPKAL